MDIMVSHVDLKATASLLRNENDNQNHWLGLSLVGKNGPASAIGAKVTVQAGTLRQVFVNQWATSYLSYNDPRMHIGLGKENKVDKLEIWWPDGQAEIFEDLEVDRYLKVIQGEGSL